MATTHRVELRLGTQRLVVRAWDEVSVTLDLLHPGSPWTLTLWRQERAETWEAVRDAARLWAPVEVTIDGVRVLIGTVERMRLGAARSGAPITLSGRDALGVALSADVDPTLSTRGATLEDVIEQALRPLGIDVVIGALAEDAREIQAGLRPGPVRRAGSAGRSRRRHHVDRAHPRPGEKVWAFIEQLCRRHGYLAYCAPYGDRMGLVIDRPADGDTDPVPFRLTRRRTQRRDGTFEGNLIEGWRDINGADVPTAVTVFGHSAVTSRQDARHRAVVDNPVLSNRLVAQPHPARPKYIRDPRARTPQQATQRGRRELARAMQDLDVYEGTVQGFAQGGRLWTINTLARVDDEITDVHNEGLITQVTFSRSRQGGHTTKLRLVPRGAIVCEPDPEV